MKVRGIESNSKGFFKKEDIAALGLPIFSNGDLAGFLTITELKNLRIKLNQSEIDTYVYGFITKKGMRGFSPVFKPELILIKGKA